MSSAAPDPSQDPVSDALRLRASDADRERVAGLLRDAFAEGRLSPVEHEERLSEVYRAATYGDLVPVLRDLPVPPGTLAVPMGSPADVVAVTASSAQPSTPGTVVVAPSMAEQGDARAVAVFGGFERKGRWVLAPRMTAVCIFGGGSLDLTDVILTSPETVINVVCVFGGMDIVVPDGVAVRMEAAAVFGGNEGPREPALSGAPLVRVTGAAVFGGIEVKRPRRKKSWRQRLSGG